MRIKCVHLVVVDITRVVKTDKLQLSE